MHPDVDDYYRREIGRGEPLTAEEFLQRWLAEHSLTADDVVFADAYVGPEHFTAETIAKQRAIYASIPRALRHFDELPLPPDRENIEPALRARCDVVERRPYGGCLLSLVMPALRMESVTRDDVLRLIERERAMRAAGIASYYAVIIARRR